MDDFIPAIAAIVGDDHVAVGSAAEDAHADRGVFGGSCPAVGVARPGSSAEVRELVAWANRSGTPLVPVSSGSPHRHGASSPSVPGALLVDLRRLGRVRRIDRRNRMVIVEPGVTYPQLQAALAEQGMRVATPLAPRANKSVVASLLEREPTLIPRHNSSLPEPLRNCGVVWGNGDVMFTGEAGAGQPSLEDQWRSGLVQAEPKGPAQTDFYRLLTGSQGTMGIVTWASIKCDLIPAVHGYRHACADRYDGLAPLMRELCLQRVCDEVMVVDQRRFAQTFGLPAPARWVLIAGFGGRARQAERRMRAHVADAVAIARRCGVPLREGFPGARSADTDPLVESPPGGRSSPDVAEIFFLSPAGTIPRFLESMTLLAEKHGFASSDVGVYIQPQHQGVTHHVEFTVSYEEADDAALERVRGLVVAAGSTLVPAGAYFSRPYGPWAGPVYDRDAAAREALRKVKAIFDPAGVMNPGKLCFGAPALPGKEAS